MFYASERVKYRFRNLVGLKLSTCQVLFYLFTMKKKLKTMEALSQAAGLSRPTLSKYFNDPASVRQSTRSRIHDALDRYDYSPNLLATNLNRRNSRVIGILVPHFDDQFYMALIRVMERYAVKKGYIPITQSSHGSADLERRALENLRSINAAGAVIAPIGYATSLSVIEDVMSELPLVSVDVPIRADIAFVGTDNMQSIGSMVRHLCRSGTTPIFLEMPRINTNSEARNEAYRTVMEDLGQAPRFVPAPDDGRRWDFERYGEEALGQEIQRGLPDGATILCANDRLAFGALSAAYKAGLRVGAGADCDLRIAGHDDHPFSAYTCPTLTTVAQNKSGIALRTIRILIERIEHGASVEDAGPFLFDAPLVERASA